MFVRIEVGAVTKVHENVLRRVVLVEGDNEGALAPGEECREGVVEGYESDCCLDKHGGIQVAERVPNSQL